MWQYNQTNEICHFGVMGMKWGKRSSSGKTTIRQANKNAKQAVKESIAKDRKVGGVTIRQANKNAKQAAKESIAKDKTSPEAKPKINKSAAGLSVVAGLLSSNFGGIAVYKLTGSLNAASMLAPAIGVIGGMTYYDLITN